MRPRGGLQDAARSFITPDGLGIDAACKLFTEIIAPSTVAMDHPRMPADVPGAPPVAVELMDSVIGVASIYTESWLEVSGVHAENAALDWLRGTPFR